MDRIEVYFKPEEPMQYNPLSHRVEGPNFSQDLTPQDITLIENRWRELETAVQAVGRQVSSRPEGEVGSQCTLWNTAEDIFSYRPTDFRTYVGIARNETLEREGLPAMSSAAKRMRVSAVGSALYTADNKVLAVRRPYDATHVPGKIDCSAAGFSPLRNGGVLDFATSLDEKLIRELEIQPEEIATSLWTGVHSTTEEDYSGMFTFKLTTPLTSGDILERVKQKTSLTSRMFFVGEEILPAFLIQKFVIEDEMNGDGFQTLAASLSNKDYRRLVNQINNFSIYSNSGRVVRFGELRRGIFVPSEAAQ